MGSLGASGRSDAARRAAVPALLLALASIAPPAAAAVRPLTLYQKTARAALVVRARAASDATRRPPMDVSEIYKGIYPGRTLYIVPFFQDYANPKPWLRREVFRKGEEYILFLNPYDPEEEDDAFGKDAPDAPRPDGSGGGESREGETPEKLFILLNADQGMSPIPAEGGGALVEAIRRFVAILALGQHDLQSEAMRGLLWDRNPYLVEAGLDEVARFELATEEDVEALLRLMTSQREDFRGGALHLIGDVGRDARVAGRELRQRQEVWTRVLDRAYNDPAASVRREAVRALAAIGGEGAEAALRAIGKLDGDQDVRYAAEIALVEMSGGPRPPR